MKSETAAKHMRRELDAKTARMKKAAVPAPERGWVHTIREALGMSTHQLAKRLSMSQSGLVMIEQSEARGTIQLSTLKKVAAGLDCELVYALVPTSKNFEAAIDDRRYEVAELTLIEVLHKSSLTAAERRELIRACGKNIKRNRVWEAVDLSSLIERVERERRAYKRMKEEERKLRNWRDARDKPDEVIVPPPGAFLKGKVQK